MHGWMPAASLHFRDPDGNLMGFLSMFPDPPQPELGVVDWNRWSRRSSSSESDSVGGGLPT
jgi:lactoylglutathione lyase